MIRPVTLILDDDTYHPTGQTEAGGRVAEYARDDKTGGLRLIHHVALIPCPLCGRPIRQAAGPGQRVFPCPPCGRWWRIVLVREPGGSPAIALVSR